MKELILNSYDLLVDFVITTGPIGGIIIVILESIFPVLPLVLFITMNMSAFGMFFGFVISWLSTVIGCIIVFYIFRKGFSEKLHYKIKDREKINDLIDWISNVKLRHLAILVALPFTPSFLVNIAGGLSKIKTKKFIAVMLIGKIFIVYFWGYIGYNLIEVFNNPGIIFEIVLMLLLAYLISRYVGDKLDID